MASIKCNKTPWRPGLRR